MKRFEGADTYIATDDLMMAVNAALTLERPLLVKGGEKLGRTPFSLWMKKVCVPISPCYLIETTEQPRRGVGLALT